MNRRHIPSETKQRIKDLFRRGETVNNVHNRFSDISISTVKRYRAEVKHELAAKETQSAKTRIN